MHNTALGTNRKRHCKPCAREMLNIYFSMPTSVRYLPEFPYVMKSGVLLFMIKTDRRDDEKRTRTSASKFQSYPTVGWVSWRHSSLRTGSSNISPSLQLRRSSRTDHLLGANLPVSLYIPKAKGAHCWGDSLGEAEVCILQEREAELVVLTDRNQRPGGVETLVWLWTKINMGKNMFNVHLRAGRMRRDR